MQTLQKPRLRGRHAGYVMPDYYRARRQAGALMSRLRRIAMGKIEGHPAALMAQIAAAKVLLAKSIPDLAAVQVINEAERRIEIITRME